MLMKAANPDLAQLLPANADKRRGKSRAGNEEAALVVVAAKKRPGLY